ncbi:DUF6386 family protein [Janthinobacterium sp. LB3P118]|uniref:DUF6386 family protein n=1 Tax=Janthinobacterium sp. LB3P118 TaxID=3424195 RepID=UPI003F1E8E2A
MAAWKAPVCLICTVRQQGPRKILGIPLLIGDRAFFNVGGDGAYDLVVHDELSEPHVSVHLAVVSGRVFIGAGEDVTGGGLEPDTAYGGLFVDVPLGGCRVQARRDGDLISLAFLPAARSSNAFGDLVRI